MIDRRTGEVWFATRKEYRNFTTKSILPLGPIFRMHGCSEWGFVCSYRTYARYIRNVNRKMKPRSRPSLGNNKRLTLIKK